MKLHIVVSIVIIVFCSCINRKYLAKNQVVFKVERTVKNKSKITAYYTGHKKTRVRLQNINGTLLVVTDTANARRFVLPTLVVCRFDTAEKHGQLLLSGKYYYPETQYPQKDDPFSNTLFKCPTKLKFSENHPVFQILTVPLKVRQAILYRRFKDSLPTQALAELNIGAAIGFKRSWSAFKAHPNEEGVSLASKSLAITGFVTLGATNVKPITSRYFVPYEKTEYAVSYGVNFLLGLYNLNIGFSVGADHLLNKTFANKWIFDGKVWYGVTVAYDIFGER